MEGVCFYTSAQWKTRNRWAGALLAEPQNNTTGLRWQCGASPSADSTSWISHHRMKYSAIRSCPSAWNGRTDSLSPSLWMLKFISERAKLFGRKLHILLCAFDISKRLAGVTTKETALWLAVRLCCLRKAVRRTFICPEPMQLSPHGLPCVVGWSRCETWGNGVLPPRQRATYIGFQERLRLSQDQNTVGTFW